MHSCEEICIPERLHKKNKHAEKKFNSDEVLFRRFNVPVQLKDKTDGWGNLIFKLDNDSYNRSSFSEPEDVLYNINANNCDGRYYQKWGIYELPLNEINNSSIEFKIENRKRLISFSAIHSPVDCMYPHSELLVFENGKQLTREDFIGPIRPAVRTYLKKFGKVKKNPDFD